MLTTISFCKLAPSPALEAQSWTRFLRSPGIMEIMEWASKTTAILFSAVNSLIDMKNFKGISDLLSLGFDIQMRVPHLRSHIGDPIKHLIAHNQLRGF
jgi:hypothetical protein